MSTRSTLTLDDDVADELVRETRRTGKPYRVVVNDAILRGLEAREVGSHARPPFRVKARSMGLRPGLDVSDIEGLLDAIEGPRRR